MFIPLLILTLISATGLLLYFFKNIHAKSLKLLLSLGAGSMLAVSLVHILRESLEKNENSIYAFLAGFVVIYIIEEFLAPHSHDHTHGDHSHEDPHEHYDHIAIISFIAIFSHTLIDGLGIRAGMEVSEVVGYATLIGVGVHQIPVSLSLAAIFRESRLAKNIQIFFMLLFSLSVPIGYILSDILLSHMDTSVAVFAIAFAGGSLLYVATSDLLPMIHAQSKKQYANIIAFLIGIIFMSTFAGHDHAGEDHTGESHIEDSHQI